MSSDHHAEKRIITAIARAALAGVTVHRSVDDKGREAFIATRWALTKEHHSIEELEAWLDRVTGRPAA